MAPTERAILQRVKESCGIKISSQFWQTVLQALQAPSSLQASESEAFINDQKFLLEYSSDLRYAPQVGRHQITYERAAFEVEEGEE